MAEQTPEGQVPDVGYEALLERMNEAFAELRGDETQWQTFRAELRAWESADADPDAWLPLDREP